MELREGDLRLEVRQIRGERKNVIDLAVYRGLPVPLRCPQEAILASKDALIRAGDPVGYGWKIRQACVCVLAAQVRPDLLVESLPGITGSHRNPDFTNGHPDLRTNLEQFRADRRHLRLRQLSRFQADPP
jgi:hypothetical protein